MFFSNLMAAHADFLKPLAFLLVEPHLKRRVYNSRLPKQLRADVKDVLDFDEEMPASPSKPKIIKKGAIFVHVAKTEKRRISVMHSKSAFL